MKRLFFFLPSLLFAAAGRPVAAQNLTNNGGLLSLANGAVLYVPGTMTNAAGGTLGLGTGGQFTVGGNFVNGGTLVPGTGAVLLVGPAAQTLDLGGATLYNLTVNNPAAAGAAVTVPTSLTVTRQLTLVAGLVRLAPAATLTLPAGAALLGETATRYVAGNLRAERSAVAGTTFVDFGHGLRLNPGGNALGNVTVTRSAGLQLPNVSFAVNPLDATKKGIDQVWRVLPATQPATPVTLELSWWAANDNGLSDFTAAQLWRRNGAGWLPVGPVANASGRTLAVAVAGPLDQFTVSTLSAPLPVELVAFGAERRGEAARLRWRTASEKNSDYFGVEVSPDGRAFRQFARVAGQGSTTAPTNYELLDPALLGYGAEVVYYRLRQVDFDGTASYSPVAAVPVTAAGFAATAAPNPVGNEGTRLRVSTGTAGPAEWAVYDGVGRRLLGQRTELLAGTNDVALAAAGQLPPGVYLMRVTQGPRQARLKLVRE